jgi:hypothetical protein
VDYSRKDAYIGVHDSHDPTAIQKILQQCRQAFKMETPAQKPVAQHVQEVCPNFISTSDWLIPPDLRRPGNIEP